MIAKTTVTFPTVSPSSVGVPAQYIINFIKRLEKKQVPMHSLLLLKDNALIAEGYYAPITKSSLQRMFSISKSVTAMAIGLLENIGKLSLDDSICTHFPEYCPPNAAIHPWIRATTIRHILMMRTPHASTTYKINMQEDWVESFFITKPNHKPGTIFHYDTSAAHVLAALVEKLTGQNPWEYLRNTWPELDFSNDSYMLTDPFGISLGGSGLVATSMDILKLGYVLLNNDGLQFLPTAFARDAISNLTPTCITNPLPSEACGYGYMIWQNERGGFTLYGMGGQLVIAIPALNMICVTTADTQGMAGGNQLIYDALYEEIVDRLLDTPIHKAESIPDDEKKRNESRLRFLLNDLQLSPLTNTSPLSNILPQKEVPNPDLLCYLHAPADYRITPSDNTCFTALSIRFPSREEGLLLLKKKPSSSTDEESITLSFGMGHLCEGVFSDYQQKYAASGIWLDENTLYIRFHILDAYMGSVHMELHFEEGAISVFMKKVEESLFSEYNCHLYGELEGVI